jgi:hypothetical protein
MPNEQPSTLSNIVGSGLRTIAASFPGFASLGQAWSEYENYKTGERITELMNNLKIKLDLLKDRVNNIEDVCKHIRDQFPSLLEVTIEKVRKEFSKQKREIYADVLANLSFQQYEYPYEDKVAVIYSLDALNPADIEVLKLFRQQDQSAVKELNWKSLNLPGDDINQKFCELISMLAKLESRGLIITTKMPNGLVIYPPDGLEQSIARLIEMQYRILPLGQRILSTLE